MSDRDPPAPMLAYAAPRRRVRGGPSKYDAAIAFAAVVYIAAALATFSGTALLERANEFKSRGDREQGRADAFQMFVIGALLVIPGTWYGYVGVRGGRPRGLP